MKQISISNALMRLQLKTQKDRREGLADLEHILKQNRQNALEDEDYHGLFQSLFKLIMEDRSNYVKSTRDPVASRLSACSHTIRLAVEIGVRIFRYKTTVRALIDHILHTVPMQDDQFCEPLMSNYTKALRIILEHRPHSEHLSAQRWLDVVEFCQKCLQKYTLASEETESTGHTFLSSFERQTDRISRSGTPLTASFASVRRSVPQIDSDTSSGSIQEELVKCLHCLLIVPHAPILEVSSASLKSSFGVLLHPSASLRIQVRQYAFSCVNVVLSAAITEKVQFAIETMMSVIPHIRRLWHSKESPAVKEAMLIALIHGEYLLSLLALPADLDDRTTELHGLLDVLQAEYSKRIEKDLLQLDDIEFNEYPFDVKQFPLALKNSHVRCGVAITEQSWLVLYLIALIFRALYLRASSKLPDVSDHDLDIPKKRKKKDDPLRDLIRSVSSLNGSEQLAALQILAFVSCNAKLDAESLQPCLDCIVPLVSSSSKILAAWAMLSISWLTYQESVGDIPDNQAFWLQVWQATARQVTGALPCRFACHLLTVLLNQELVCFGEILDTVDAMLNSVESNGPAILSDASVAFWITVIGFKGQHSPALVHDTSERVLRWLFIRWRPSHDLDRLLTINSQHYSTEDLTNLVCAALGLQVAFCNGSIYLCLGALARAKLRCERKNNLIQYLLLDSEQHVAPKTVKSHVNRVYSSIKLSRAGFRALCYLLFDFLNAEVTTCLDHSTFSDLPASKLSIEAMRAVGCLCVVSFGLVLSSGLHESTKLTALRSNASRLRDCLVQATLAVETGGEAPDPVLDGLLSATSQWLSPLRLSQSHLSLVELGAFEVALAFDQSFWQQLRKNEAQGLDNSEDVMKLVEVLDSQNSHARTDRSSDNLTMDWLDHYADPKACKASLIVNTCLCGFFVEGMGKANNARISVPVGFVEYLTSLSPMEFLACRQFFDHMFAANFCIDSQGGSLMLEYMGQIFESYDLERNEVAMGTCLDIMTYLADQWVDPESEMADAAAQLYHWFIKSALHHKIASNHTQVTMSKMLQRVVKTCPEYAKGLSLPSARTSLFQILEEGPIVVKYAIGTNVSDIFNLFILKEHDTILEDVLASLPMDLKWFEGSVVRLFVLGRLAASWSTLIRRCVYTIVEAPALAPASVRHAEYCLADLSSRLGLETSRELLKLFISQILYTWLDTRSLESIPYSIFKYKSLEELVNDNNQEIVAQIVMRGRQTEGDLLSKLLSEPYESLVSRSFGRCAAYCIARDATISPDVDPQASNGAVRLRRVVGKDKYGTLIMEHFPDILATFFKIVDREEQITKGFQKHKTQSAAHQAYDEMLSSGASVSTLTVSQQPSFKATCLVDEIEYICQRSPYDFEKMWTPALYVYVFRDLLRTIHPALGSVHTCSAIRRIRILVSMGGEIALHGYPLEMALHSLQPFLSDSQCAEDVMGLFRYLLIRGGPHLEQVPAFFSGLIVSMLVSLKVFMNSPQDSTTQESQFRTTMSKAQQFHQWIGDLAQNYNSSLITASMEFAFRDIIGAARMLRDAGNARKETPESKLLLGILNDRSSGDKLINETSQNQILKLLCQNFQMPRNFRDDILGMDQEAIQKASAIWSTYEGQRQHLGYIRWVARVLGRAYAAQGFMDQTLRREVSLKNLNVGDRLPARSLTSYSRCAIVRLLCESLFTSDLATAGIVERTLQAILSKADSDDSLAEYSQEIPASILPSLTWKEYICPALHRPIRTPGSIHEALRIIPDIPYQIWIRGVCLALVDTAKDDAQLSELMLALNSVQELPHKLFPYLVHLVLLREIDKTETVKRALSAAIDRWLRDFSLATRPHLEQILHTILYLRSQPIPRETTMSERSRWLEFDHKLAADVAAQCRMYKTALLLLEIGLSEAIKAKPSRRSSDARAEVPVELLLLIFRNLDEKDSFYGIRQPSSLSSMMDQLEYENAGFKSLSFRGAFYDAEVKHFARAEDLSEAAIIRVLDSLDLNGLSQSISKNVSSTSAESMLETARKLERWDISSPGIEHNQASILFRTFQDIHSATDRKALNNILDLGFSTAFETLVESRSVATSIPGNLSTLAVLTEVEESLASEGLAQLEESWVNMQFRESWMVSESLDRISTIASCRKTLFSSISKSADLQRITNVSPREAQLLEVRALLASSNLSRQHGAMQSSLGSTTYLAQLVQPSLELGLKIDAAVQSEASNVLWDQGEMSASIRILQDILHETDLPAQDVPVGKPELLARLGHRIAEARLEQPDEVISNYLVPAIKELHGVTNGAEAGQVFHEFASFCDQQLQSADSLEDFRRVQVMHERKGAEVRDLDLMLRSAGSQSKERDNLKAYRLKAKQWFELDDREFQRLRESRQALLRQSLENYLLSLKACDSYDRDVLRFSALWLEHFKEDEANEAVKRHIEEVSSSKFATLLNQWTARLLDESGSFQTLLSSLVFRICLDHPYHGMYHIFASSKTKGGKDQAALSRHAAATAVVARMKSNKTSAPKWIALHNSCVNYVRFATEKSDEGKWKQGAKVLLRKSVSGLKLEQEVTGLQVPPPTIRIPLRRNGDYSDVPRIVRFSSEFSIASGISAPKILTAVASDGRRYKALYKGGNDDLRQDAIMEQVFEQVSDLLESHRETRQRNLGIRTYKVLPLTSTAGIIEFVSDTIPLHEYLIPAHVKHFPNDLKSSAARKIIHEAQTQGKSNEVRLKEFRKVCEKCHPVLRYFFMERFENPDDWFDRRLAYTRSTAAISILGHILGLGDRHGHNILLDEKTGEVVHIDLGIAFEQGRVLPVPELVPFRLTRDIVDGMGITKTEGVFRRCCEFTLDALRKESYSIMTILDVLRYDPLYSWSLSPLRLKRLQGENVQEGAPAFDNPIGNATKNDKKWKEEGEADRALTVVAKKLSKSLSVTATVNELIQQASDERNLALLFAGWAAYL